MFREMDIHCDSCDRVLPTRHSQRGSAEAYARIKKWGCWPGLTIRGRKAPEHMCPQCVGKGKAPSYKTTNQQGELL